MSEEIEKLIKIQGAINRNIYHLHVETDLENSYKWILFQYYPEDEKYFSRYNQPILNSNVDSIDYLIDYLKKHNGFRDQF
ncbi:MAG: hypothetical protein MR405_06070 [Mollicutes bacterium]|nr:hypothetical protein [Mollicutes bacterium]MCI7084311.1 hypothetical protein [Mycoplasmatota bacterium]